MYYYLKNGRTVEKQSSKMECGQEKILNDRDWQSLKCLEKSNHRKTTVELEIVEMFKSESRDMSTCTVQRELKGLGLNSCVA